MSAPADPGGAARARARARLADAARLLPALGAALLLAPDLLLSGGAGQGATAPWLLRLFAAWLLLIGLAAWVARRHARLDPDGPPAPGLDAVPAPEAARPRA